MPISTAVRSTDRDAFWAEQAALIDWQQPFEQVCDYEPSAVRALVRRRHASTCATTRSTATCATRGDQNALIYVSTETDQERVYSFRELHAEVQRMAAGLLALGVKQGDRVLIYMPMIAEAAFAMLACARIGAIHSVVFGGFASASLASRIDDAEPTRDRQRRRRQPLRQGRGRTSRCSTRRSGLPRTSRPRCCWSTAGWRRWRRRPAATSAMRALREQHLDTVVPCAWVDSTAPELHALHQRHHRQAQGRAARHRRLCGGAGRQHEAHLLRPARRDLLLHQRHRLGRRPQLHRLRPADRRHGDDPVRRPADPARRRHLVAPGREVQGHRDVQRADRGAGAEEAGPGVPAPSTTCRRCARCSWPASRSTSRPRTGSPRRSASRSSTTTGRPRPAGRS